jgi:hypothetical protein
MFLLFAIILFLAWIAGFTILHVTSASIHLLLLVALVSIVVHLVRSRSAMHP